MASSSQVETSQGGSYTIEKLEGQVNFNYWKEQIYGVLVIKKLIKPIRLQGVQPDNMDDDDDLAKYTILLSVSKNVYFNVANETTMWGVWQKLSSLYAKESASSRVFLMKKIFQMKMKESTLMGTHLNEFNGLVSKLIAQKIYIDEDMKAVLLLCTLPESWDTFRTCE